MSVHKVIECRNREGITIGLIDSIGSIAGILQTLDLDETDAIQEALIDLTCSEALKELIERGEELKRLSEGSKQEREKLTKTVQLIVA